MDIPSGMAEVEIDLRWPAVARVMVSGLAVRGPARIAVAAAAESSFADDSYTPLLLSSSEIDEGRRRLRAPNSDHGAAERRTSPSSSLMDSGTAVGERIRWLAALRSGRRGGGAAVMVLVAGGTVPEAR